MSSPRAAIHRDPEDREGLSPSPGVVTIADLLDEDDDDIDFEPQSEQSVSSDEVAEGEDDDEYVGMNGWRSSAIPRLG